MGAEPGEGLRPPGGDPEEAAMSFEGPPPGAPGSALAGVVARNARRPAAIDGVHGIGEGRTPAGDPAVRIDDDDRVREALPREIEGFPVEVVVVPGGFDILPEPGAEPGG